MLETRVGINKDLRLDDDDDVDRPFRPGVVEVDPQDGPAQVNQERLISQYVRDEALATHNTFIWDAL